MAAVTVSFASGLVLLVTACSGGTSSPGAAASSPAKTSAVPVATATSPAATGSAAPVGSQPSTGPDAIASITADWTAAFDPTTPVAQRIKLLQSGATFRSYLEVQAQPGSAHLTTEQVTGVTLLGSGAAAVTYNIEINGVTSSALSGQGGTAIFSSGTWQVSSVDFCDLLTLENKGKSLPGC